MKCIPTSQGTGNSETALCNMCFSVHANQMQARANAANAILEDIDPEAMFEDCSYNDVVQCCICGDYTG